MADTALRLNQVGVTPATARVLAPLASGSRHEESIVAAAAGCRGVDALRTQLTRIAGRLAAIRLRVDRRKSGISEATVSRASTSNSLQSEI